VRVVVPYAPRQDRDDLPRPHPLTVASVLAQAPDAEFVDVSSDEFAYWRLLCELWADGETFLMIEHDNEIAPGMVEELDACEHLWCSCPLHAVRRGGWWMDDGAGRGAALQVNRWQAQLLREHPRLIKDLGPQSWRRLDGLVLGALHKALGPPLPPIPGRRIRHRHLDHRHTLRSRHWPPSVRRIETALCLQQRHVRDMGRIVRGEIVEQYVQDCCSSPGCGEPALALDEAAGLCVVHYRLTLWPDVAHG
jgi:hypothetical protein